MAAKTKTRPAGHRPEPKLYRLAYEDREGLQVTCKSLSIGSFLKIAKLAGGIDATNPESLKAVGELFDMFSKALVSWNVVDDDGAPVPTTVAGIETQDLDFILETVMAWVSAIADVAPPLPAASNSGATAQVPSLPMAPLSASQAS